MNLGLNSTEIKLYKKLNTPAKIQDYLDSIRFNFETKGETCNSPRMMLREKRAHCIEGAFFAASVLWFHGQKPLLLDLVAHDTDFDHVVALFKQNNRWGAISKTNHNVLRWRDPVYLNVQELAMSYFHEYFLDDGRKSLQSFSQPFDLSKFGTDWVTSEISLLPIADKLDMSRHVQILTSAMHKTLRLASNIEIKAGEQVEWKK
jgi:hypothetical protein